MSKKTNTRMSNKTNTRRIGNASLNSQQNSLRRQTGVAMPGVEGAGGEAHCMGS